jgi:replicative DNA helicase
VGSSSYDHCQTVLIGILAGRRDLLDRANRRLMPEHFNDQTLRNVFIMINRYFEVTGGILTRSAVDDILRGSAADAGRVALYQETFDLLVSRAVDDVAVLWSVDQIVELAAERATSDALVQAMAILNHGAQDEKGETLRGHGDARHHVLAAFAEIDKELAKQASPEGDMRSEGREIAEEYETRKQLKRANLADGYRFGIPCVDDLTGGLQPGDLGLIAGYTSAGKSALLVQLAWHMAICQGKNVVVATTETLRPAVRRKIISRHSLLPQFGLAEGINSRDIRRGSLSTEHEKILHDVLGDFTTNPAYGHLHIMQVPYGATIPALEARLMRVHRQWPIHLVAMDYLQLLHGERERRRHSDREEQSSIVKAAKQLATTFDDGGGLCVVSPWQVNRTSREIAGREHHYSLAALSETAEASNSPDVIMSILEPADTASRYVDLLMQVLKNRDGMRTSAQTMAVRADYATSSFSEPTQGASLTALAAGSGSLTVSPANSTEGESLFVSG